MFRMLNTLSNSIFGATKFSLQIGFIQQLLRKGVMHKILPIPPCWEKIIIISIPSYKIPKEFLGSTTSLKIFYDKFLHCGSTKKMEKYTKLLKHENWVKWEFSSKRKWKLGKSWQNYFGKISPNFWITKLERVQKSIFLI
jgi:hypothetical protein